MKNIKKDIIDSDNIEQESLEIEEILNDMVEKSALRKAGFLKILDVLKKDDSKGKCDDK